jgi:hypothetical protein
LQQRRRSAQSRVKQDYRKEGALVDSNKSKYWFPAKRYGWGWGLPCVWQGWAVLLLYFIAVAAAYFGFDPAKRPIYFGVSLFILSILLIRICYLKGEKPKWRWGDDK